MWCTVHILYINMLTDISFYGTNESICFLSPLVCWFFNLFFLVFSGESVLSRESDKDGHPLLHLTPPDITVYTFHHLSNLLQLTEDKKMKEVQACLEGQ